MNVIQTLSDFVEVAQRNRKYPTNSVYGYRAALKVFDEELSSEERESLELFNERLEQIYSNILSKKKSEYSISSLEVYKKRIVKILSDYKKYGIDPSKMASWNPVVIKRVHNKSKDGFALDKSAGNVPDDLMFVSTSENSKHEYSLRPSKKIVISYPSDFTFEEAKSIKSFAEYLVSMRGEDHT